jgi:mannose-1-phosphate guanylyltransferase/mannose-6-phosphate isomerase
LWNSGIFLFSASRYLEELAAAAPDMVASCRRALAEGATDLFFFRLGEAAFSAIAGQSIDYAVMERTTRAAVMPVDMGWSDIGSWSSLWRETPRDRQGNATIGDVLCLDCTDTYVRSEGRLVAAVGVRDLVVVATDDAVLVADKARDQEVRRVVEHLRRTGRPEGTQVSRTWRPWGWFETLDEGPRYRVKMIEVAPGAKLSLQRHRHRSEHWVVVTGTALVTRGEESFVLTENQSTFIPAGATHRLENPEAAPLCVIEVQSGSYVGEDDIERLEDVYGRHRP